MESDNVKLNYIKEGHKRIYTIGIKREGAESFEFMVGPAIPYYDSPAEAIKQGRSFVELAGTHSTLVRGPYAGSPLEKVDVCAIDITSLVELGVISRESLRRPNRVPRAMADYIRKALGDSV